MKGAVRRGGVRGKVKCARARVCVGYQAGMNNGGKRSMIPADWVEHFLCIECLPVRGVGVGDGGGVVGVGDHEARQQSVWGRGGE